MNYLSLALKYWRECIIVLLIILFLITLAVQNHTAGKLNDAESKHADYVLAQEQVIAQAKAQAAEQEKLWSQKITQAEQTYNAKIKEISADADAAQSTADSLSKQLATAKQRLSTATTETVIEYSNTNSDVLEDCIGQYRGVAKAADEHAAAQRKLDEAWPEKALN